MSFLDSGDRTPRQTFTLYAVILVGVFAYFGFWAHKAAPVLAPFWDARVYQRALGVWERGQNPYLNAGPYREHLTFLFVSPPAFLGLMGFTRHLAPGAFGFYLYLFAVSLCTLAIPALLVWAFFRGTWMSAPLALVLFAFPPNHYGTQALLTGNVSSMLYAAVLATAGWGLYRRRWLPFYGTLVFAGLLKPMFLAFLVLPLLAADASFLASAIVVALVAAGYALQVRAAPLLFRGFKDNVHTQLIVHGDTGFGLLTYIARYLHHVPVLRHFGPSVTDGLFVTFLAGTFFVLRRRGVTSSDPLWVPGLVVLAVLSNPRIQAYDADVAIIPAVYVLANFFADLPSSSWKPLWVGAPMLLFVTLVSFEADLATCLLLVVSAFAVIARVLWPARLIRPQAAVYVAPHLDRPSPSPGSPDVAPSH